MSKNSDQPIAPKPYDFIPISLPITLATVGHETRHGKGYNSGKLAYQITALSPLFVAGGSYLLGGDDLPGVDEPVVRAFYRVNGQPVIPGSSLKGLARSVVEAISPSCVTITRLDPRLLPQAAADCQPNNACPACSIFGRMSRMAKVTFTDARLVKGKTQFHRLPALFSPRAGQAKQTYQAGGQYKGRKFYYHGRGREDEQQPPVEIIPPKSLLHGEILFENLSHAELGLLFIALGFDASFALKLGGGKPACLGSIQVQPGELTLLNVADFLQAESGATPLTGEAMVEAMVKRIRTALKQKLILREQLDKLREIWRYPNDRDCPAGLY
ncbi:MAG: RAMP superfamily CRISPR-associated protein [Chloroflexota bacterium]